MTQDSTTSITAVMEAQALKTLSDNLPDMLWIKDTEGVYLFANKAICDHLLMAKDTNEPIGKNDVFFALRERATQPDNPDWHTFGELCFNSDEVTIQNNKPMRFEEYGHVKGKMLYLEVHKAPFYDEPGNILGTVGSGRDITEMVLMKQQLEKQAHELDYQAHHDLLTGLPNRLLFQDRLDLALKKANRNQSSLALLLIGLDHFKHINDAYGYDRGDQLIQEMASRLKNEVCDADTFCRLGGDEFILIMDGFDSLSEVAQLAVSILNRVKAAIKIDAVAHYLTASIGISLYPADAGTRSNLLKYADSAMYRAKEKGRDTFEFYTKELTRKAFKRVLLVSAFRNAMSSHQLELFYQSQVDLLSGRILGMECLIRWNHPQQGLISPDEFIPMAEETGLIVEMDRWVFIQGIRQFKRWQEQGIAPGTLSLNLAVRQIEQPDFISFLSNNLEAEGVSPEYIELEITETQVMENLHIISDILHEVQNLGIKIAIDDFGTGYSSLAYLKRIKANTLKIDASFIECLPENEEDAAIVRAILAMANSLKLNVVAEGIETQAQQQFLIQEKSFNGQGYWLSRPVPAKEMEKKLLQQHRAEAAAS